jgi:hypothetical protein
VRHTFESGQWIDVLPIQGLKAKHKDAAEAAIKLYVSFDKDGNPDLSQMPISMSIAKAQRHVIMAICIAAWSFTAWQLDTDGDQIPGTETALPVPEWHADGAQGTILYEDSFGELEIDDANDLEAFFAPYMEKLKRRPDPKGTITSSSNGTSRAKAKNSRTD